MNWDTLLNLITEGESETLEFKKSTGQLNRAGETLCGFLNNHGGKVLIGVNSNGTAIGITVSDGTLQEIANNIFRKFEPPPPIEMSRITVPGKSNEVIILEAVPAQASIPFCFDGRPYQRIETTTSVMPQARYQQLLLHRLHSQHRWENAVAMGVDIKDMDQEEILRTIRRGMETGRIPEATGDNIVDILDRIGIRVDGKLLNAAVILFGTQFLPDYPQCQLRMARFQGVDKTSFLDNRQVYGNGFQLLEEATLFLRRHLPVAGRIQPGIFEREDEPLFPLLALREALVNAICHRDYANPGGAISLAIFDDRLEIWNDGTLPFGLKVEDLKRDHPSKPRNPLIAEVFYKRGLVERWGRGTQKIVELCVKAGHPEPEYIEQSGSVGVRFLPSQYIAPHRVTYDLTHRQREILQILSDPSPLALREIISRLKVSIPERTVREDLRQLKELRLVDSYGHGRGAVWFLQKPELDI